MGRTLCSLSENFPYHIAVPINQPKPLTPGPRTCHMISEGGRGREGGRERELAQHDHPILRSGAEPRSRGRADGAAYSDGGDSGDFSWVLTFALWFWLTCLFVFAIVVQGIEVSGDQHRTHIQVWRAALPAELCF